MLFGIFLPTFAIFPFLKDFSYFLDAAIRILFQLARVKPQRSNAFREKFAELPFITLHIAPDFVLPVLRQFFQPPFFEFSVPKITVNENG